MISEALTNEGERVARNIECVTRNTQKILLIDPNDVLYDTT